MSLEALSTGLEVKIDISRRGRSCNGPRPTLGNPRHCFGENKTGAQQLTFFSRVFLSSLRLSNSSKEIFPSR